MSAHCLRIALCVVLLSFASGCTGWLRGSLGATSSMTLKEGRQGGALALDAAVGDRTVPVALDFGLRAKAARDVGDGALYTGLVILYAPEPVGFYALGGTNLLQVGGADGSASFGMFTPSAEIGLLIGTEPDFRKGKVDKAPGRFTIGASVQYDVRFTEQPHEGFFMLNLGYALVIARK